MAAATKAQVDQTISSTEYKFRFKDVYIGAPCKLGKNGVEEILELKLSDNELKALQGSAEIYKKNIDLLGHK